MSLDLHQDLKARLTGALAGSLPNLQVRNGMFFNTANRLLLLEADQALPDHGSLRDKLLTFVDDFPLMTFVYDVLQAELLDLDRYDSENPSKKISEIEGFSDSAALAERLVAQFDSLPWQYTLSLKLPSEISDFLSTCIEEEQKFSSTIRLVKATEEFAKKYPLNCDDKNRQQRIHGAGTLLFPKTDDEKWSQGTIYLQIETDGFIGPFGGSAPAIQAERLLKSFVGLGIALRLFQIGMTYFSVPPVHRFYVHRKGVEAWAIDSVFELNTDNSRVLSEIKFDDLLTSAKTEQRKKELVDLIFREMSAVFSGAEKSESIILAAEWLLDSYAGRDPRLNYVQSMVVLEVVLGDKAASDLIGLGQLLRNRCAYLIGKNHEERSSLLKDFDEIYKVRSQIVHRGKARLSFRERVLFGKLQDISKRVIQREVDLLRAK